MKNLFSFSPSALVLMCGLLGAATSIAAPAQGARPAADPGTLQVQVNVPPSWRPMFEDRVTETFVTYIEEVFRRQGFKGKIVEVRWYDEPSPGCCLLTINLTEWRMNHIGNIDCVFTANLQTDRATRHLGIFSGMSLRWMSGPGRFGLSDAFGDAAEDAIRQLYSSMAKTELVPGLQSR
jgi:hypothetical protein